MATAAVEEVNPRAVMGGNNPPIPIQAKEAIDAALEPLELPATELLEQAEKITVVDDDNAEPVVDLVKRIKTMRAKGEEIRKAVKAPFFDATKTIDAEAKQFDGNLQRQELRIGGLVHAHQEKLRKAAEKAERDAREAIAAEEKRIEEARKAAAETAGGITDLPPAPPAYVPAPKPASAKVVGATGARTVSQTQRTVVITDPYALPPEILTAPKVTEALVSAVNAALRLNPALKHRGFRIDEGHRTVIR
jgi:hypothetical protein